MRVHRHELGESPASTVLTLGNFDGVHRGHREILARVVEEARALDATPAAITFFPHPAAVLAPDRAPTPIASLADRLACFRDEGIELVWVERFTLEFSKVRAVEWIDRRVLGDLAAKKVVVGHRVSFGHRREGDVALLESLGRERGFALEKIGPVLVDGDAVSSTEIRNRIRAGDVADAAKMLGRPVPMKGRVVPGRGRGRGIGIPTANLAPRVPVMLPNGVYAAWAREGGRRWGAVVNIGTAPTFADDEKRTVEAHLLEFDGDLYGRTLELGFVERLRDEKRFPSVDELVRRIRADVEEGRSLLGLADRGP